MKIFHSELFKVSQLSYVSHFRPSVYLLVKVNTMNKTKSYLTSQMKKNKIYYIDGADDCIIDISHGKKVFFPLCILPESAGEIPFLEDACEIIREVLLTPFFCMVTPHKTDYPNQRGVELQLGQSLNFDDITAEKKLVKILRMHELKYYAKNLKII